MGQHGTLYGEAWRRARTVFLREHPFCALCGKPLHGSRAIVDHITPHRGDVALFWDRSNWQALCKSCHDSHKQRAEKGGLVGGCNAAGIPSDPRHPWNR